MKLEKTTFQISYLEELTANSYSMAEARKEWPCLMVPDSQFCFHVCMHRQDSDREATGPDKYGVSHVPSGKAVREYTSYRTARQLLARLEASELPKITEDENGVSPADGLTLLRSVVFQIPETP